MEGKCMIEKQEINKVICEKEEIRMLNLRNRKKRGVNRRRERKQRKLSIHRMVRLKLRGRSSTNQEDK